MSARRIYFSPEDSAFLPTVVAAMEFTLSEYEQNGVFPNLARAAAHALGREYDPHSAHQRNNGRAIARIMGSVAQHEFYQDDVIAALDKLKQYQATYAPSAVTN